MQKSKLVITLSTLLAIIAVVCILLALFTPLFNGNEETLQVEWQTFLPDITGEKVIQTSDGGYLALGTTAELSKNTSNETVFVNNQPILVKTNSSGNVQWQQTFQVEDLTPKLYNIAQTNDGGYAVIGGITSPDQIYPNTPYSKFCLIKLDSDGNITWTKTYTSPSNATNTAFISLFQTEDDGYVLFGVWTLSWDYHGVSHGYLVKTDASGNAFFSKEVSVGAASSMEPVDDGYIFFASHQASGGGTKYMLTKLDFNGTLLWSKDYQGDAISSYESSGVITDDDGYILAGSLVNPEKGWLVKTDLQGTMLWNKTYPQVTAIHSVANTQGGGFVLVGVIYSDDGSRVTSWLAKTDSNGNLEAQLKIEQNITAYYSTINRAIQTSDGGYICVGTWNQTSQASDSQKFWLFKISP
ncbi:MAG: hypothetical protein NWF01_10740 [Candidatus Bathyarchaeota archaeon]|nr:hypothetical protein [Candidatus Bathyarchaeota archaeon]